MRTKEEILDEASGLNDYNPHGAIPMDTNEITFLEVLIDIRDQISVVNAYLHSINEGKYKEALKEAGVLRE